MPAHPRALMELYNEINLVFMPANTTSILQPMDQGVISTFKLFNVRNIFCKGLTAIDSDSSDESGQSLWEISCKGFTILEYLWFMEEVKIYQHHQEFRRTLLDDLERFKTSVEEVIEDVVEIARELESEVEPEGVAELLQAHDKTLTDE